MNVDDEALSDLRATARTVAAANFDLDALRALREASAPKAEIGGRWKQMAELGWTSLLVPEALGGAEAGMRAMAVVQHALGSRLAVTPLIPSALVAATVLASRKTAQRHLLDAIVEGDDHPVLAVTDTRHFGDRRGDASLVRESDGWRLVARARHVPFASTTSTLLVVATTRDGDPAIACVPANSVGLERRDGVLLDGQPTADVRFDMVVPDDAVLRDVGGAIDRGQQRAALALAAWSTGGIGRAIEITAAHLRDREQFGVPIGAFQALQHRIAALHCEAMLCTAITGAAAAALDGGDAKAAKLVHAAKARTSAAYVWIAGDCLQLHGGLGMTDDAEIGFHLKAARVAAVQYGSANHHRARLADVEGYGPGEAA